MLVLALFVQLSLQAAVSMIPKPIVPMMKLTAGILTSGCASRSCSGDVVLGGGLCSEAQSYDVELFHR